LFSNPQSSCIDAPLNPCNLEAAHEFRNEFRSCGEAPSEGLSSPFDFDSGLSSTAFSTIVLFIGLYVGRQRVSKLLIAPLETIKRLLPHRSSDTIRIQRAPGFRLRRFAEFLFTRRTFELVLEPVLRDLLDEYYEALGADALWKSRWVCVRGYWSFWSAVFAQTPISLVKKVYQVWKAIP
jgi:hypothetical protein